MNESDADNGLLTGTNLGNVTDSITYNNFGETDIYQVNVNGSAVFVTDYTTDALGRITAKTETVNGQSHSYSYVYDTIGQLTDVYRDGSLYGHYEYDFNGNRVAYNGTNGTASDVYDDQDRMTSYGGNAYQYTSNGELKSKTNNEGIANYTYDVLGNLTEVNLIDETKITYLIDGANRRIGKKVNGVLTQGFLYQDQLNPVAELDSSGNVVSRFVYGTRSNVPDYLVKDGVAYRIVSDHLGSIRLVINTSTGDIVQKMEYDEFGRVLTDTNPGFQPFGFAGGVYDNDTKLTRFGKRDYDAETGRWTCKDPIGFNGGNINLYGYTLNDPVNMIDPLGLWTFSIQFDAYAQNGARGSGSVGIIIDNQGNFGAYYTSGAGAGSNPAAGFGVSFTRTNANSIWDTSGNGWAAGGSLGFVSVNKVGGGSDEECNKYTGTNVGFGPRTPFEMHGETTHTNMNGVNLPQQLNNFENNVKNTVFNPWYYYMTGR